MSESLSQAPDTALLAAGQWQGAWFDGQWRAGHERMQVVEPATGETLAEVALTDADQVRQAAETARAAQRSWAAMDIEARAAVMERAAALFGRHAGEIEGWIVRECGSVPIKAAFEIRVAIGELRHAAAQILHPPGQLLHSADSQRFSWARRVPLGVVSVITPWNFPLLLAMRSVAPALITGNAVLLKPDPHTPVSGGVLIARIFEEAGLPAGVLSVLPGGAAAGEACVCDVAVRMVTFTGSSAVGRRVGELAGRHLKKCALELGGNSPLIVLEDADLERAVNAGAFGSFFHQGQICMASSRHIVHERIAVEYTERLVEKARSLRMGNPTLGSVDLGPMINHRQVDRALSIVNATVAAGGELLTGGRAEGLFFQPTVLAAVGPEMPAFAEELFAPIAPITVAQNEAHAIELANGTPYGLAAAVITADVMRGLSVAQRLHVGMVHVNDQTVNDLPQAPMGGRGHSGNGARFSSGTTWEEFTEWQWVTAGANVPPYP